MRFATRVIGFMAASALMCGTALAGGGPECAKACDAKAKAACTGDASKCSAQANACMPKMAMMVGDKSYECPMAAGEAAKKESKSITYKVAGKSYDSKEKAMAAYADTLEEFAAKFASVRTTDECKAACAAHGSCGGDKASCSKDKTVAAKDHKGCSADKTIAATDHKGCSADKTVAAKDHKGGGCADKAGAAKVASKDGKAGVTFCVAGQTFACKEKAEAASKTAAAAMKEVNCSYRVGSKNFDCDKMAGEAAKKNGDKVVYVVGKDTIDCPIQARIETAKAKIAAAMAAINKGQDKPAPQKA